ncbi:hypothetical protein TI05_11375 [Achromatium sp. WMS3]|nr:hypothetical protein TI05_11375 [Achromatium sp. WMS3]
METKEDIKPNNKELRSQENIASVIELSKIGIPHDQIAALLDTTKKILETHFKKELLLGSALANREIGGTLYNKALEGDVACLIFWTKCRMKWREKDQPIRHEPVQIEIKRIIVDVNPDANANTDKNA